MAYLIFPEKDPLSPAVRQSQSSISSVVSGSKLSLDKDNQRTSNHDRKSYSYSKEISTVESIGSQSPSAKSPDSPGDVLSSIMDMPAKAKDFRELAKHMSLGHYIAFYENYALIKALASTEMNPLVHSLLKAKVKKLATDYLEEKSPFKLSISEPLVSSLSAKFTEFENTKPSDAIDVSFIQSVMDEVSLTIIQKVLHKYRPKKSSLPPQRPHDIDTLQSIMKSQECDKFLIYLAKQNKLNLYFYYTRLEDLREYATNATSPIEKQSLNKMVKNMHRDFIASSSPCQVFCSESARIDFEKCLKEITLTPTMLEPINKEVYTALIQDALQSYLNNLNTLSAIQTVKNLSDIDGGSKLRHSNTQTSRMSSLTVNSTVSQLSSGSGNLGGGGFLKQKLRQEDSSPDEMAKILDNPAKLQILKEVSDKHNMMHYIEFYERQNMLFDLAANDKNAMLINLINQKLEVLQKNYLLEKSPSKLTLFSESTKNTLLEGIKTFKAAAENTNEPINVDFLLPAKDEIAAILAKSLLPKFKQKKKKEPVAAPNGKSEENTIPALVKVLDSEIECDKMIEILAKQHCMENLFYYQKQKEIYAYAATATSPIEKQTLKKMIKDVGKEFIVSSAPCELNIPSKLRSDFEEAVKENNNIPLSILEPVTKEVLSMLLRNSFPLYRK